MSLIFVELQWELNFKKNTMVGYFLSPNICLVMPSISNKQFKKYIHRTNNLEPRRYLKSQQGNQANLSSLSTWKNSWMARVTTKNPCDVLQLQVGFHRTNDRCRDLTKYDAVDRASSGINQQSLIS